MAEPFPGFQLLLEKYPYYAHVLARLQPMHDPSVGTVGVSASGMRFYLHVNLDFVARHHDELLGLMLHEVHHIVLGHLTHPRFQDVAHPDLMEVAMEVTANEYVTEPLPGTPIRLEHLAALDFRPRQSTMERYHRLAGARIAGQLPPVVEFDAVDTHLVSGVGRATGPPPGDHATLRSMVGDAVQQARDEHPRRRLPLGMIAGLDPGELLEHLDDPGAPAAYMDWRAALQRFVARVRAPVHTYGRPSRRFPDLAGVVPGRRWYPGDHGQPKLLVAIDTSGSMSTAELTEIAAHLRMLRGLARITVAECDARIQRVYRFERGIDSVKGRGGTDFRPVFEPRFLEEHDPDGVIYFSDGWGPYPEDEPAVETLWVLTDPGQFDCPWGDRAVLRWG